MPFIAVCCGLQVIVQKYEYDPPTVKVTVTEYHLANGIVPGRIPFDTLTVPGPDIVNP